VKTLSLLRISKACTSGTRDKHFSHRMLKMARLLTRPTLAVISPSRPESAKTDSLPWDAPCPKQGCSSSLTLVSRLTFHGSWERCENEASGLF
jgi:hypothetical protein